MSQEVIWDYGAHVVQYCVLAAGIYLAGHWGRTVAEHEFSTGRWLERTYVYVYAAGGAAVLPVVVALGWTGERRIAGFAAATVLALRAYVAANSAIIALRRQ